MSLQCVVIDHAHKLAFRRTDETAFNGFSATLFAFHQEGYVMRTMMLSSLALTALLTTGCVTKQTHESALLELEQTRTALGDARSTIETQRSEISTQQQRIEDQKAQIAKLQKSIGEKQAKIEEQERLIAEQKGRIEDQLGQIESNRQELARGYGELKSLDAKKAEMQKELEAQMQSLDAIRSDLKDSKRQFETLKQIEAETQKRNEIYASFIDKLKNMIDGGQLTVSIEQGRIVINLPENVLFPSGSAMLNSEGRAALKQVAGLLSEFSDRRFQIEGHTDNVPIKTSRYPSNWELSTARALSVVHLMTQEGVAPQNVSAAGFGEFHPRADNETQEGRSLNRRIEIIMLPNLDILSSELPKLAN